MSNGKEKTDEELKAEEEAKKKAEKEAKKKADETPPAGDKKDKGEDLASKDVSKYTVEQMLDYIDKLKDENAKRRIAHRDVRNDKDKAEEKLVEKETKLAEAEKTLSEVEKSEKKKADAEKGDVDRLTSEVEDLKKKVGDLEGDLEKKDFELTSRDHKIKMHERETMIDRILVAKDYQFSSDYERRGFMESMLKIDGEGEFELSDDRVIFEVQDFIKKNITKSPPKTPSEGPTNRSGETPLNEEIKALTSKRNLTEADKKRLDELLELSSQAAEFDERRT